MIFQALPSLVLMNVLRGAKVRNSVHSMPTSKAGSAAGSKQEKDLHTSMLPFSQGSRTMVPIAFLC